MIRPVVVNRNRLEQVDLQPYGNTISVETLADNPFEDERDVVVCTQMSGGLAGPDPRQTSRRKPASRAVAKRLPVGMAPAVRFKASAHRAHTGFMPGIAGLGADPLPTTQPTPAPTSLDVVKQIVGTGTQIATQVLDTRTQKAIAAQKEAEAAAAAAAAQRAAADAQKTGILASMNKNKMVTFGFLGAAALALGVAVIMKIRSKKR